MTVLFLICLKALLTLSWGSNTGIPQVDKLCPNQETCEIRANCPFIEKKYKVSTMKKGTEKYAPLIKELKEAICNREERAFCCPRCFTTETNENGGKVNTACVFPFTYRGVSRTSCLEHPKYQGKWCSTKVDSKGNHIKGNWGFCQHQCEERDQDEDNSLGTYLPSSSECGGAAGTGFIVGGADTKPGEFPFNALLGYRGRCRANLGCVTCPHPMVRCTKYKCGGTLINRRYVLTAAHCHMQEQNKRITEVVLGEWKVSSDPDCSFDHGNESCSRYLPAVQKFNITAMDVTVHEEYRKTRTGLYHDIALVRLPRLATLNVAVQPVCLPWSTEEAEQALGIHSLDAGLLERQPTVVGWGYTALDPWDWKLQGDFAKGPGNVAKNIQQKLQIPLLSSADCEFSVTDKQICGAGLEGKGSCNGDSGSGLYLNSAQRSPPWFQVGIVSYGSRYCASGSPTIYTRVSSYTRWITQNLQP